jgi:hypothetical protein
MDSLLARLRLAGFKGLKEKIMSWEDAPTGAQIHRIAVFAIALGIKSPIEEGIQTRGQARDILNDLYHQIKQKNRMKQDNGITASQRI